MSIPYATYVARRRAVAVIVTAAAALLIAAVAVTVCVIAVRAASAGTGTAGSDLQTAVRSVLPTGSLSAADGDLPEGARVTDTDLPGVGNLDPTLLAAVQAAAVDAAESDIEFTVTSGWRSAAYQQQLLDDAVTQYGSAEEAARWVATPDTSEHVAGRAIDIGDFDAAYWLGLHGAGYGLCQTYANESWHFELQPDAPVNGCAEPYADPTFDPRMTG